MRTPATKKYTESDLDLLSGKIQASTYCQEVQDALKAQGIDRSHNYITQVVTRQFYNEQVWDAVMAVLQARKVEKQIRSRMVALVIAD